ncbi:Gp49 family protein [Mesorhizobium yinganensis]|uniref:Gp49 family protein n=1 Tax=Mesorhizobium yinganensis TaxID=3157707 RepID=UPI0032B7D50D
MQPVTEKELIDSAVGERVTLEKVEASIASEHYFTAADGVYGHRTMGRCDLGLPDAYQTGPVPKELRLLTFCVLVLQNGYTVHGISACADPNNFNPDIGRRLAKQQAVNQIWPLLGFELRTKLHTQRDEPLERQPAAQPQGANAEGATSSVQRYEQQFQNVTLC